MMRSSSLFFFLLSSEVLALDPKVFKDLRSYYDTCGLVGRNDPLYASCMPANMSQIMEQFQKDPKNVETMKKISRFHMTHSLQTGAKKMLSSLATYAKRKSLQNIKGLNEIWAHESQFILTLSPSCQPTPMTSLELGQSLTTTPEQLKIIKETIEELKHFPCPVTFKAYALGVVDPSLKPDVWMIDEKGTPLKIKSSTGRTPFE